MRPLGPVLLALAFAVSGAAVRAADVPLAAELLRLKDPRAASGRRLRLRAAGTAPGTADPRLSGASLEIAGTAPGDGTSGMITLPAEHWKSLGRRGVRYFDRAASAGVRKIVLGPDGLAVAGGGPAWTYRLTQAQSDVTLRLSVGDDMYCADFTRFVYNEPGRLLARYSPAPARCTVVPRCGDHTIDAPEECDDGNTVDGDGCSAACLVEHIPCGNGVLEPDEECDDRNRADGDGCSATCRLEACAGVVPVQGTALDAELVVSGLANPVHIAAPRLDLERLFVVEQPGRIRIIRDGALLPEPFLAIEDLTSCCGEQGLLSVAFHPSYATNGRFFVMYTDNDGAEVIARYQVSANADVADERSEKIVLTIPDFASNHNGGQLAFGPDGYLYASVGDGGGGGDPEETGQDGTRLLGKILRLDVDVDAPPWYAVPPSNPFVGRTGVRPEIWALGLRNPWRMSFDRASGDLYIADVGQGAWEEIDVQPGMSPGGENYGWDVFEGDGHCYEPEPPAEECPEPPGGFVPPVLDYDHGEGCSVTGGHVYRGCAMPDLRGTYFYADFCSGFIRTFRGIAAGHAQQKADRTATLNPGGGLTIENITSFGEDGRGELYIADHNGEIFKIVPEE
jgi:hypothetical protein